MKQMIAQVNHPGSERVFNVGGRAKQTFPPYIFSGNQWIRDWNIDKVHYRKLILNPGKYVEKLKATEKKAEIIFWGEWEAPSIFLPFEDRTNAYGLHVPFLTDESNNRFQNTDPYVFGSNFKYAICYQTGIMTDLAEGSLVLFGSTTKAGFLLDTVFVVKNSEIASSVYQNQASNYSIFYKKVTLDNISSCRITDKCYSSKNRIYTGKSWTDDNNYFSFVPCKVADAYSRANGIEKLLIPHQNSGLSFEISKCGQGHPYKHFNKVNPEAVWRELVQFVLNKGYFLGTYLEEPGFRSDIILDQNRFNIPDSGMERV